MSLGFPRRFTRDQLGPTLRNNYPIENPESDVGAETLNPLFHQVSGMNLVVPRAVVVAEWNGSSFDLLHQAEAWNPDGDQVHPVLARASGGAYTYTFAPEYEDEEGVAQATVLLAARGDALAEQATFADRLEVKAWIDTSNPLVVQVRLWIPNTGSAADFRFWLEVL